MLKFSVFSLHTVDNSKILLKLKKTIYEERNLKEVGFEEKTNSKLANVKNIIILIENFALALQIPRETGNNVYAKFCKDKQRVLFKG